MALTPTQIFGAFSNVNNLLSNFFAVDVVGIYNQDNFEQIFKEARPVRAEVRETSTVMNHPVETGVILSDHHIINPVEISITLTINSEFYDSVYNQIKNAFIAATLLSVQTRTSVYNKMIIANMPHQENPDTFDMVIMNLHLKEVLFVVPNSVSEAAQPQNFSPSDPANSNTVSTGQKYPARISATQISAVQSFLTANAFKFLGGI